MRVRTVVINWNSFELTDRCLESLSRTTSTKAQMSVVVVDNGSVDGSLQRLESAHPWVEFISNDDNLGFAEACNQGMRDRGGIDAVALVNNDAVVEPEWLDHLIDALEANPRAGAAAAMLILDPGFVRLNMSLCQPMMLDSVTVDGVDATGSCIVTPGTRIGDPDWPLSTEFRAEGDVTVFVPAKLDAQELYIRLRPAETDASSDSSVHAGSADQSEQFVVRTADGTSVGLTTRPDGRVEWQTKLDAERTMLVNGLGTRRSACGEAYDIGFGEPLEEFDPTKEGAPPDGFCGGGVLLRTAMLDQVGLFDPRLFAYYEDTDLSWRMTRAGWEIVTVPKSRIHHAFGGSGGSKAPWFFFLNYRNWMLVTIRNGDRQDLRLALSQLRLWLRPAVRANIASRLKHRSRPSTRLLRAWVRVILGVLVELPRLWLVRGKRIGLVSCRSVRSFLQPR